MKGTFRILIDKIRITAEQIRYLPRALSLVWAASGRITIVWGVLLVLQGLIPLAIVFLTRLLVNSVTAAIKSPDPEHMRICITYLVCIMAALLFGEFLRVASSWVRTVQSELVEDYITGLVHQKSFSVDLAFYDSPAFYDRLHRARFSATQKPLALLEGLGNFVQNGITLITMAAVLIPFGFWVPIALVVSTLPALFVVLRYTLLHNQWLVRNTEDQRRTWYYDWLLTDGATAAELRLLQIGNFLSSAFQDLRRRLRLDHLGIIKRENIADLAAGTAGYLIYGFALVWMIRRTVFGQLTLGDLALFYQAFQQGQRLMRMLLENFGRILSNILYVGNLFEFLELNPIVNNPLNPVPIPSKLKQGIQFSNVTFRYPGSERVALRDFNLFIPAGQTVAIVGPNGAGKSTLIKLLCRFYDPESGRVELDGIDLKAFQVEELRALITVLFQEPAHFSATASQNIQYGNLKQTSNSSSISAAARNAGAENFILRLPDQYDTELGRYFGLGTELSVGEWQRLSLARAFFRQVPLILLDEPTSAMDSWAETDWMKRFRDFAIDRTAVIITHRFTTARKADLIYVMSEGRIIESGSHEELVASGGIYSQSWGSQIQGLEDSGVVGK